MRIRFCLLMSFVFVVCIAPIFGQYQQGQSFYDFMGNYYNEHPDPYIDTIPRTGFEKTYDRAAKIWGPRLYPHGDCSVAGAAINAYANAFNAKSGCFANIVPAQWKSLGPTGMPTPLNPIPHDRGNGVGQIHRLTFDPDYDGTNNKTIYAASMFGGLWRSEDDGLYWEVVNTDTQLPMASVSDVAVDYNDSDNIFISTGYGDGGVAFISGPNWGNINPVFTVGIYRSQDYGANWEPINDGFMSHFQGGGTTRRLLINPANSNQLFVVTSEGVFRCNNALSSTPGWSKLTQGLSNSDKEYRGLEFKPGAPSTVYVSGQDIYKSTDDGNTWQSMTGFGTGLDIASLPNFTVNRINIAVTPADPDRLYAYIQGNLAPQGRQVGYIYMFENNAWTQLYYRTGGTLAPSWLGLAAHPLDPDQVFFGFTDVYGSRDISSLSFTAESPYSGNGFHADVHALVFQPNVSNPKLFCANHGGVSVKDLSFSGQSGWQYRNEGLSVVTIWSYDVAKQDKDIFIIGNQDCGVSVSSGGNGNIGWNYIAGGDGYGAQVADDSEKLMFFMFNTSFYRYSYIVDLKSAEGLIRPRDTVEKVNIVIPESFQVHVHPVTGKFFFGFCELYERLKPIPSPGDNHTDIWKLQSDVSRIEPLMWKRQINEFAISHADPNYVFVVTGGVDNGGSLSWDLEPRLFRSTTGTNEGSYGGANKFADITSNLPTTIFGSLTTPVITGIALHPDDPLKLWVSFTGYDPDLKVWGSDDGGDTWFNADPNGTLANLPVNGIEYQYGTNDRLYIATDAGVYVKDNAMSCWEKYGDIPNVRVVEIRVNTCTGKLTAATFGRGVWEADMLPATAIGPPQEITTNVTWNDDRYLSSSVVIKAGNTLTITKDVYMPAMGKIVVEPYARLILDGGRITNRCGAFWQGIEVWGDSSKTQAPINHPLYQGLVELKNGAVLENARNAVALWKPNDLSRAGGVVIATDAVFKNNRRSVEFVQFQNRHPSNSSVQDNISSFTNTMFTVDDDYPGMDDFHIHASLWAVKGVKFRNCSFVNNQANKRFDGANGKGIYSIDAGYWVTGTCNITVPQGTACPFSQLNRSSFHGLNHGIHATATSTTNTVLVDECSFKDNVIGFEITGQYNSTATRSLFEIGDNQAAGAPGYHEGIRANSTSGYRIEENQLFRSVNYTSPGTGIRVGNSGPVNNQIYKNSSQYLAVGEQAEGVNRNNSNAYTGLQILCNTHSNSQQHDIAVLRRNTPSSTDGIRTYQGDPSPAKSAGNIFSRTGATATGDYYTDCDWPIIYYHTSGTTQPLYHSPLVYPVQIGVANGCPSNFDGGIKTPLLAETKSVLEEDYMAAEIVYQDLLYNYHQLVDGGNTPALLQQISESWTDEAWALRDELMSYAPYLSDKALWEAAALGVLPHAMLLEICLANPEASRGHEFLRFLHEGIEDPLPEYMLALIEANWETETPRTLLEGALAEVTARMAFDGDILLSDMMMDSVGRLDEIRGLLRTRNTLLDRYLLADSYMESGDPEAAISILDSIQSGYELSEYEVAEWQSYRDFYGLRAGLWTADRTYMDLDSTDLAVLRSMVEESTGRPAVMAGNILCFFYGECIVDTARTIGAEEVSFRRSGQDLHFSSEQITKGKYIFISPNPADDVLNIRWDIPEEKANLVLVLKDITGKAYRQVRIQGKYGSLNWNISAIPAGVYICDLLSGRDVLDSEKVMIRR